MSDKVTFETAEAVEKYLKDRRKNILEELASIDKALASIVVARNAGLIK